MHEDLFVPLKAEVAKPANRVGGRKAGPRAFNSSKPTEVRRAIVERYISKWRKEVGNDFYPALRLLLPDKDRDRAMYGLKEKVLARYLIKIMKIDKNSEDGYNLLNWKQPGIGTTGNKSGVFSERAYDILKKRPFRNKPGPMTIREVNDKLDELSREAKEEKQLPIIQDFYRQMNPDEMKWLICIILREMKIGVSEKTLLSIWHPDADTMFNISSSLKRVCWELWNSSIRLRTDNNQGVELFSCFQPQLAGFQAKKVKNLVKLMGVTEEDPEFWIEEKLDGERMQMHWGTKTERWKNDGNLEKCEPYKAFEFWSRKAKDYTYLYGTEFDDENSALTRHLKDVFDSNVDSIILDGEMITWDTKVDKMVPFGTLKTAALEHQKNQYSAEPRPLYRVFDILMLNGTDLTQYTLRDRREALKRAVNPIERRLEIVACESGKTQDDIERALRKVVAEASEGLVVKNPRSRYILNDRNNDWFKVKPEYMEEFGESLDCLVVGAYYGSGRRGGGLSSFLCGLRVDVPDKDPPYKFLSFFKVGGGMTANDYANIRHHTENKWHKWDPKNPPTQYVELGGGEQHQRERPDVWILPEDSLVIQAKAASVGGSDEFAAGLTLRFPRFQKLRSDKDWKSALSFREFLDVQAAAEDKRQQNEEKMKAAQKNKRQKVNQKRPLQAIGYTQKSINEAAADRLNVQSTDVFKGLTFFVMTDAKEPQKKTKLQLEELVKSHGGKITQTADPNGKKKDGPAVDIICIAGNRGVRVASLIKRDTTPILKPVWLFDCIEQARTDLAVGLDAVPLRPEMDRHIFHTPREREDLYDMEVDQYGDSFGRDTTIDELRECMSKMDNFDHDGGIDERLEDMFDDTLGWMLRKTKLYFPQKPDKLVSVEQAMFTAEFAGASVSDVLDDPHVTHVVVDDKLFPRTELKKLRADTAKKSRLPRLVTINWVADSWKEQTRLDEERYAVV